MDRRTDRVRSSIAPSAVGSPERDMGSPPSPPIARSVLCYGGPSSAWSSAGRGTEAVLSRSRRRCCASTNTPLPLPSPRRLCGLAYPAPFEAIASEGRRRCAVAIALSARSRREALGLCDRALGTAPAPPCDRCWVSARRHRRRAFATAPLALSHRDCAFGAVLPRARRRRSPNRSTASPHRSARGTTGRQQVPTAVGGSPPGAAATDDRAARRGDAALAQGPGNRAVGAAISQARRRRCASAITTSELAGAIALSELRHTDNVIGAVLSRSR